MIIVNKPTQDEQLIKVQCYKCKAIFFVRPLQNTYSNFIKYCHLHNENIAHPIEENFINESIIDK